jgi:hypothetical protein
VAITCAGRIRCYTNSRDTTRDYGSSAQGRSPAAALANGSPTRRSGPRTNVLPACSLGCQQPDSPRVAHRACRAGTPGWLRRAAGIRPGRYCARLRDRKWSGTGSPNSERARNPRRVTDVEEPSIRKALEVGPAGGGRAGRPPGTLGPGRLHALPTRGRHRSAKKTRTSERSTASSSSPTWRRRRARRRMRWK